MNMLPVVPASISTADGAACAVLDASSLLNDPGFDANLIAVLARDGFAGGAVARVLMDHFVSRRGDEDALRVVQTSCQEGSALKGRILSGDFVRLVATTRPEVYADFSRTYLDDPQIGTWCSHSVAAAVSGSPAPR